MRYLSVCSGIEAATVAWHPLGWTPVAFSEIEPFPSAVIAHHYPHVPNLGDMTKYKEWPLEQGSIDLLVGGTPCQSFSVAGLRKGLSDPRGGLMLTYLEIAQRLRPRWVVWENVPGVLSSNRGRDFGSFLGALGHLGYGWAYRVLDAQWCRTHRHPRAVPQRRRRVFVVGCLGDSAAAASVLFERESVQRDSSPRRATREEPAADAAQCFAGSSASGVAAALETTCHDYSRADGFNTVVQTVVGALDCRIGAQRAQNAQAGHLLPVPFTKAKRAQSATDDETWVEGAVSPTLSLFDQGDTRATTVAVAIQGTLIGRDAGGPQGVGASDCGEMFTLTKTDVHAVAFHPTQDPISSSESVHALGTGNRSGCATAAVAQAMTVRRLTPRECERLQGFPDDYTLIAWRKKPADDCPDGPRYKALGNSMAVNCMEWIGQRIAEPS